MCFSCFSKLRPRYKRLVDDIFPALPQDGLVKSNMEKLTFYALSSPEKLDRIGEYLYQNASRDITRKRVSYVKIAMEAMDQLLVACHSQTLNLFVESFLRMVQRLLECPEPELQIMATQSFVRFANIEEDTPSYHRRYDFFVSKFSSMCHNSNQDQELRDGIRLAGIKGLQGVIRKTVTDDLVENIWEPVHMDKIIPSLLYNMQNPIFKTDEDTSQNADTNELLHCNETEIKDPAILAESCFRELVGRASFGHVKCVIRPVLHHFDLHGLWISKSFAIHCFRLIMFSIQSQYLYTVVESLMEHLNENSKLPSAVRTNVADVLSKIISIAARESVGPTVLEIINSLLTHLRNSVNRPQANDEKKFQEALILALGEFVAHLPDYQKIEIAKAMHLMPDKSHLPSGLLLDQSLLVDCLNQVGIEIEKLAPSELKHSLPLVHRNSWVEVQSSMTDVSFVELNSNASSPRSERKYPNEDLTFEAMKKVLTESAEKGKEQEAVRNANIYERYKSLSFPELIDLSTRQEEDTLPFKLNEIFGKMGNETGTPTKEQECYKPKLETLFPECFVY